MSAHLHPVRLRAFGSLAALLARRTLQGIITYRACVMRQPKTVQGLGQIVHTHKHTHTHTHTPTHTHTYTHTQMVGRGVVEGRGGGVVGESWGIVDGS